MWNLQLGFPYYWLILFSGVFELKYKKLKKENQNDPGCVFYLLTPLRHYNYIVLYKQYSVCFYNFSLSFKDIRIQNPINLSIFLYLK